MSVLDAAGTDPAATYRALARRRRHRLALAATVLALVALGDLMTGPAWLGPIEVVTAIVRPGEAETATRVIVLDLRAPMTLMALVVGAALGLAGALMQTVLANPLASPYTLGISAAAGFGAALAILTGLSLPGLPGLAVPLAAFAMATLATGLVYGLANARGMTADVMVLAGIATLFLFQSAQSLVQYLAAPEVLQAIVFWLFGSLLKAGWTEVGIAAVTFAAGALLVARDPWRLTALGLGDAQAAALGVDLRRLRARVFFAVALLTAGAVAFVGTIGFVGLVAPHLARALVGEDQRSLLPMAALVGALIVAGASIVSKLVSPGGVVPIGIVTAVIGVPFLFGLILRRRPGGV